MSSFDHISAAYSLPPRTTWVVVSGAHMNESWIGTVDGHPAYVLRRYHPDRTSDDIQTEHRLLIALAEPFPVQAPQPLETTNGSTMLSHQGRCVSVFTYLLGQHPNLSNPGTVVAVSQTLAECHAALWAARVDLSWMSDERPQLHEDTWPSSDELEARLEHVSQPSPLPSNLISVKSLQAITDRADKAMKRLAPLRPTSHLIHADINASNLLFDNESSVVTAVLDWDECRWDMPIFDLCGLLSGLPDTDLKSLALQSYGTALVSTEHPYAQSMQEVENLLPDADIVRLFNEVLVMLASGRHQPGYVASLLTQLAP